LPAISHVGLNFGCASPRVARASLNFRFAIIGVSFAQGSGDEEWHGVSGVAKR
jgi:hypothetical protein